MELTEFASLIASGSTNTAKNTLSYLIGNGQRTDNWSKALAELYKSFPKDVKESEDSRREFFPIIAKYFITYELTKDNISIFKEYENLYSAKMTDELKKFNPKWIWDEEPEIIFKNSLAFTRGIPQGYNESRFDFINKYENQFAFFVKKQKDKILQHFESQRIWIDLRDENYIKYVELCDKYKFDRVEILKNSIVSYSDLYSKNKFEPENINWYLEDLVKLGKENLNVIKNFYPKYSGDGIYSDAEKNVYGIVIQAIANEQYKSAIKWMIIFETELNQYAQLYEINDFMNHENFKKLVNNQLTELKSYSRNTHNRLESLLKKVSTDQNWFYFMKNYELLDNLNEKLKDKNTKEKKIKI